ncbi:hypothetical protein DL93DRAFT_2154983 [Clavulina sp. PMI_390]|nr:hypothetical protein DL93DRAFT_2154983 [Clavulina sp. PMI_390]
MVSALASQLAQGASVNAALLASRSGGKPSADSFLFSAREAAEHDLDSILALAQNGLAQLSAVSQGFAAAMPQSLFSDSSRHLDRTLLPEPEVAQLNADIALALRLVSPHLLQSPAAKIIEWLVRRFRVHEFNQNDVLACFIPYHDSTVFAKMASILSISPSSIWAFVHPFKEAATPLPRTVIASEMVRRPDLARFIVSLLPDALDLEDKQTVHRSLVAFSTGVLAEYITRHPKIDEGTIAFLLPACVKMVEADDFAGAKDVTLAGAILLASLSHRCELTPAAIEAVLGSIAGSRHVMGDIRTMQTIVSVLSPQTQLPKLPSAVTKEIIRMSSFSDVLSQASNWAGSEKTLIPLVTRLLSRKFSSSRKEKALEAVVQIRSTPDAVAALVCSSLLTDLTSDEQDEDENTSNKREMLSDLYQTRHAVFTSAVNAALAGADKGHQQKVEQLVLELSLDLLANVSEQNRFSLSRSDESSGNSLSASDAFFAATSIDASARITGVQHILDSLASTSSIASQEHVDVLISLMTNPSEDPSVLKALYEKNPVVLANSLLADKARFMKDVVEALSANVLPTVDRNILRLHLDFMAKTVLTALALVDDREAVRDLFEKLFLPFLLFSKSKQKRSSAVWGVIAAWVESFQDIDIIKGCVPLIKAGEGEGKLTPEEMVELNTKLVSKFADNVMSSDNFHHWVSFFTYSLKIRSAENENQLLSLSVIQALLSRLSGAHQTDLAHAVLVSMFTPGTLERISPLVGEHPEHHEQLLAEARTSVVNKPSSASSLARLQGSILLQISNISPPSTSLFWLEAPVLNEDVNNKTDTRGPSFIRLARTLYQELSTAAMSPLVRHLLLNLFINVGDAAILFLAGLWCEIETSAAPNHGISAAALHHAKAFITAHQHSPLSGENEGRKPRDFQVVFPALLIALQSPDRLVREAAVALLTSVASTPLGDARNVEIYAFDTVYRDSSSLQYLESHDFEDYVQFMSKHAQSFVLDPSYLTTLNRENLTRAKSDGKKERSRKEKILCYLTSHIVAFADVSSRLSLLRSVAETHDSAKLVTLRPRIEQLLNDTDSATIPRDYVALLIACFNGSAKAELINNSAPYWTLFMELGKAWTSPSESPLLQLYLRQAELLYQHIEASQRIELATVLIEKATMSPPVWLAVKPTLPIMVADPIVCIALITQFKPTVHNDDDVRAQKRPRTDSSADAGFQSVVCLLEAIQASSLTGSVELARALLDLLHAVSSGHTTARSDLDYLEQVLISVLDTTVSTIKSPVSSASLQVDVLVRLIGTSENPQTFNQALLLIGNMARFASESIIHTIMPIFTFIDKNVIHRDDEFSFKVVQQAITNIVPVMVSHLRRDQAVGLDLYIAAREFLALFTDAASHVPQHRRNKFLNHFTQTLGTDLFLAPVCLLLVDRVSLKVARQSAVDRALTLAPALLLLKRQSAATQLEVILETAREVERLTQKMASPSSDIKTFLIPATEQASGSPRAQLHALIYFILHAWQELRPKEVLRLPKDPYGSMIDWIIGILLALASGRKPTQPHVMDSVAEAAQDALIAGLDVIPVARFMSAIQIVATSENEMLASAALDLLADRVGTISATGRMEVASNIAAIVEHMGKIMQSSASPATLVSELRTLRAVASAASPTEEGALTVITPMLLDMEYMRGVLGEALPTLEALMQKLGPRLIPHLRKLIAFCIESMRIEPELSSDAISVLSTALSTLPSFWGAEFGAVVTGLLDVKLLASPPLRSRIEVLMDTASKMLPASVVLPTLLQLWDADPSSDTLKDFFDLLERALTNAPRAEVVERLRPLFTMFLEVFDLPSNAEGASSEVIGAIEAQAIRAFLAFATKLSEVLFTPLFRRLQDWAWTSDGHSSENINRRKVTTCRVMSSLLQTFNTLMAPYAASLLPSLVEVFEQFSKKEVADTTLWSTIINLVDESLTLKNSESVWNDKQLASISSSLIGQIAVQPLLPSDNRTEVLPLCLAHLAAAMTREDHLKALNLNILMQTRSEDARVRLLALRTAVQVWTTAGYLLSPFVTDTITFIHECAEDENDSVAKEARKLKRIIEGISGPIGDH